MAVLFRLLVWGALASQVLAVPTTQRHGNGPQPSTLPTAASKSVEVAAWQLDQLAHFAHGRTMERVALKDRNHCTLETLRVRRDWRRFSSAEKKAYIKSVRCLQRLPARTPAHLAPGARTRYDDFVVTHMNQTLFIHYTGTFLAWHRYFVYEFEQALRNECGYDGDFPYWNWPADTDSLEQSPVFDGSDTSMSGNGASIGNRSAVVRKVSHPAALDPSALDLPAGTGGGCVTSGPFVNYTITLGPAALAVPGGNISSVAHPLESNPRCFKRDLTTVILQQFNNYTAVVDLLVRPDTIWDFEMTMQGVPGSGAIGVHGGGHFAMGGDPGDDLYVSPGDPAFWHHHGMIDRVWWMWQQLDWAQRRDAIAGTGTMLNEPPSANTTLDTVVELGYAGVEAKKIMQELMSTTDGPFCYVYE